MTNQCLIQLDQFGLRLAGHTLLSKVSWSVSAGQIWAIIGLSGCGKSSLLRAISGLSLNKRFHTVGDVYWRNKPVAQWSTQDRVKFMAWVPQQEQASLQNVTVQDRVLLGLHSVSPALHWENRVDLQAVDSALTRFGLKGRHFDFFNALSGGEKKRVALACAYLQNATVTLLDEPLSQLDWRCQVEIGDFLLRLPDRSQRAVVWVTHDPNMALRYATHVFAFTQNGEVWQGKSDEIISQTLFETVYGCDIQVSQQPKLFYPA